MDIEPITFGSGINLRNSPLLLKDGELVSCEGFSYDYNGVMTTRPSVQTVNDATLWSIHSIHRVLNLVVAGDEGNIRYKWDLDGYCDLYTPPDGNFTYLGTLASANRWRVADYAGFMFIATENDMYAFLNGYFFNCSSITSPTTAPAVVSSGGSGTPANHTWYYTYVYRFTNGHQYESGLSPGKVVSANPVGQSAAISVSNSTQYPLSGDITVNGGIDASVVAMYHFDGLDGSTTITDSSGNSHTGTCHNHAQLDTAVKKIGTASLMFDAAGDDYVSVATHADFQFGTGDFTIDYWIRLTTTDNGIPVFFQHDDNDNYWWLYMPKESIGSEKATFVAYKTAAAVCQYNYTLSNLTMNAWHHFALVRNATTFDLYLDGIRCPKVTIFEIGASSWPVYSADIDIGGWASNTGMKSGWMDEIRISKGTARWTSDFIPQEVAYSVNTTVSVSQSVDGVDVFWKAYKTSDTIGNYYECYSGIDKYTLSGTDTYDDSTVLDNAVCSSNNYGPWPSGIKDICTHLQRLYGIKENKLYYSEPYLPFAVDAFNNIAITSDGDNLTSVVSWGGLLFISSTSTWFKLVGTSSDTWSVSDTFSDVGTINKHTAKKALQGIVSLFYDGLYLFDGLRSRNISDPKLGAKFFIDISDHSSCFAEFHNNKYYFFYPSTGTTCDKCMIVDFTTYPDLKYYYNNFVPNAFEYHVPTGIKYYADTDGYQYEEGGSEVIPVYMQTGDKAMKNVLRRKQLQFVFYDISTGGKDVTVSVYVDGVNEYSFVLNHSTRKRSRHLLPKLEGHSFSISVSCADSSGLYIYEPWGFGYSFTGE